MSASDSTGEATRRARLDARLRSAHQRTLAILVWLAVPIGTIQGPVDETVQLMIAAVGVVLLGLPHGAVDPFLAAQLARSVSPLRALVFLGGYVLLAGLVVVAWSLVPGWTLAAFLAISIWHFGSLEAVDRRDVPPPPARIARTLVCGALPVATPLIFRPEETSSLFARLVGAPHAMMATSHVITTLLIAWLASWIWLSLSDLVDGDRPRSERRVEWTARLGMLLALATLPALLGFTLYFCLDHSIRHTRRILPLFDARSTRVALRRFVANAGITTVLATVSMILAYSSFLEGAGDIRMLRVIFVGLAALTLPHFVLAELAITRSKG